MILRIVNYKYGTTYEFVSGNADIIAKSVSNSVPGLP